MGFRLLTKYYDSSANFADPCSFNDGDDSSVKREKDSSVLSKSESSRIFHEVVNLIAGFFPSVTSDSPSSSPGSIPWLDVVSVPQQHDPRVFLTLFKKLAALSKEVSEHFQTTAQGKTTTSSALPGWGDIYRLSDRPDFHKAPKLNEFFAPTGEDPRFLAHNSVVSR